LGLFCFTVLNQSNNMQQLRTPNIPSIEYI
jgi:hypothetical protein